MLKKIYDHIYRWLSQSEKLLSRDEISQNMTAFSLPSFEFYFMLSLSAAIAFFGLVTNSASAIIGAMIIAPLMSPIMSLSYGLISLDLRLLARSAFTAASGAAIVVILAYMLTLIFGLRIVGSEILGRTSPSLIDLGIAMAAGAAAAFAHSRSSIISSIAGVAIAVALVPPLAVTGVGLATGEKGATESGFSLSEIGLYSGGADIASGSFLLFVTNLVGIVATAYLVMLAHGYAKSGKAFIGVIILAVISVVVIQPLNQTFKEMYVKNRVIRLINKSASGDHSFMTGEVRIEKILVSQKDDKFLIELDAFIPRHLAHDLENRIVLFREVISADIESPVELNVQLFPLDVITIAVKDGEHSPIRPTGINSE